MDDVVKYTCNNPECKGYFYHYIDEKVKYCCYCGKGLVRMLKPDFVGEINSKDGFILPFSLRKVKIEDIKPTEDQEIRESK